MSNGEERNGDGDSRDNAEDDADHTASEADSDSPPPPTHEATLTIDATLDLLAKWERREILTYLVDSSNQCATIADLVEHLIDRHAEREGEVPAHDYLETTLLHTHVPKMADMGIIDYDERSKELRYWQNERLENWLALIRDEANEY